MAAPAIGTVVETPSSLWTTRASEARQRPLDELAPDPSVKPETVRAAVLASRARDATFSSRITDDLLQSVVG